MSQSTARTRTHRRSVSVTSSGVIPMLSLFSKPTLVDLLVVGGGGGGSRSTGVGSSTNTYQGMGGGGGAGGAVIEYNDVWVCSDLDVRVGAGGATGSGPQTGNYGYVGVYNHDGEQSSVTALTPGPFSGSYTAPGGESGGFSVQGGYAFLMQNDDLSLNHLSISDARGFEGVGAARASDEAPFNDEQFILTRYNRVHSSVNAFKHNMKNFSGTAEERFSYAVSIFSSPMYNYYDKTGTANFPGIVAYNYQMIKNPGRGNYNGSTGGSGGGQFSATPYGNSADSNAAANYAHVNYPGQDGGTFADGYSTNKSTHTYGAGGGGGACGDGVLGGRGSYGAGSGASAFVPATNATPNSGGGGGGGHPVQGAGGSGGSGLVVISWYE